MHTHTHKVNTCNKNEKSLSSIDCSFLTDGLIFCGEPENSTPPEKWLRCTVGASGRTWPEARPSTTSCKLSWHCWQNGGVSHGLFSVQNRQKYFSFLCLYLPQRDRELGAVGWR